MTGLARDLDDLAQLEAIHGRESVICRPGAGRCLRPVPGRRRGVHPQLGTGTPSSHPTGRRPDRRPARASRPGRCPTTPWAPVVTAAPPPLAADLEAGLRRLRLSAIRNLAPELLVTAKTQRWKPDEFLRTLIEAEIASRDLSNARARMKVAAFPVTKTLEEFDVAASSVKRQTFEYLSSLEWIRAKENLCLVGPAGTGKSHLLVALGHHAIETWPPGPLLHRRRSHRDPLSGPGRQLGRQGHHPDPEGRPHHHRRDRLRPDGLDRGRALLPPGGRRL